MNQEKINHIYSQLKEEYDKLNPELKDMEGMDKKGEMEFILVVLNKIRKVCFDENYKDHKIALPKNHPIIGRLLKLAEEFYEEYMKNQNYEEKYKRFKDITLKYEIFPKIDDLTDADRIFFKFD